jgi:hypothetical protein
MKKIYDIIICDKNTQTERFDDIVMRTLHHLAKDGSDLSQLFNIDKLYRDTKIEIILWLSGQDGIGKTHIEWMEEISKKDKQYMIDILEKRFGKLCEKAEKRMNEIVEEVKYMQKLVAKNPDFKSFNMKIRSEEVCDPQYIAFEKTTELFAKYGYLTQQDYLLDVCPEACKETVEGNEKVYNVKAMFVLDDEYYDEAELRDMLTSFCERTNQEDKSSNMYNVEVMSRNIIRSNKRHLLS